MSIVITTPTGHVGSALVHYLLDAGREDLVLLLRDASKLDAGLRDRVETREGTLQDADYVRDATRDADAIFWLSPPNFGAPSVLGWYETLSQSVAGAVESNKIGHVVHLSSEGAQDRESLGPVSGLGRVEDALDATGAAVRHLRPTFFFENFEAQVGAIRGAGAVFFPAPPERTTGMIAVADIARRAADLLSDLSWAGTDTVSLQGPRDYSYAEAAMVLGDVLGRDVRMQQVSVDDVVAQLKEAGAPEHWAHSLAQLYADIGGSRFGAPARTPGSTTPTTLEAWAREHFRSMVEAA